MGDSSRVMNVPRKSEENFVFAFNDYDFSDRILHLEITPEEDDDTGGDEDDDPTAPRKKLKQEKYNDWFSSIQSKDSKSCDGAKLTTLHINSPILAAKSPFFYKLLKNGMRESQGKSDVYFKIKASEEASLMDLIKFMYGETALNATSFADLVDLLIAADKFEVNSCMDHCVEMLQKFTMTLESALVYLELPSSVLVSELVKPLIDAAKQFVAATYKDFTKSQDEAMQLPVSAIEVVLGGVGLQVASEDNIFDFVLKWARVSYPVLEERREVLTKRLAPLICFPNMSVPKLKEVLACTDFDHEQVLKIVMEDLFSKVEQSCVHLVRNSVDLSIRQCGSFGRVYSPHCVVFFDLTKLECASLFPTGKLDSPQIRLGEKLVYLSACGGAMKDRLGLFVMGVPDAKACTLDYELAVMKKSSMEFESKLKNHYNPVVACYGRGLWDILGITLAELMSDDSDYFIDGILRFRAELTLKV